MKHSFKLIPLLLVVALLLSGCQKEAPVQEIIRPVKAVKVGDLERLMERKFPGRSSATEQVELSFRLPGRLMSIGVDGRI